ncbi:MAG: hypothetical protein GEV13_05615 [Rhodospirillales bacterium]|nr:hypothetical protein [Rhodospirillales bacterium]
MALVKAAKSGDVENAAASDPPPAITLDVVPRKRENLSIRKRSFVMKRASLACALCGASGHGVRLEIDHKVAFSQGGDDTIENLQTLCFDCNGGTRDSHEAQEGDRKSAPSWGYSVDVVLIIVSRGPPTSLRSSEVTLRRRVRSAACANQSRRERVWQVGSQVTLVERTKRLVVARRSSADG